MSKRREFQGLACLLKIATGSVYPCCVGPVGSGGTMGLDWDVFMFFLGFSTGAIVVLSGFLLARVRRQGLRDGDRFLRRLGSVGAQRFLEVAQD